MMDDRKITKSLQYLVRLWNEGEPSWYHRGLGCTQVNLFHTTTHREWNSVQHLSCVFAWRALNASFRNVNPVTQGKTMPEQQKYGGRTYWKITSIVYFNPALICRQFIAVTGLLLHLRALEYLFPMVMPRRDGSSCSNSGGHWVKLQNSARFPA